MNYKQILLSFFVLLFTIPSFGQHVVSDDRQDQLIGANSYYLEDRTGQLSVAEVAKSGAFIKNEKEIINLGISRSTFWLRFEALNISSDDEVTLNIDLPTLNYVELFGPDSAMRYTSLGRMGNDLTFSHRENNTPGYIFGMHVPQNKKTIYYMKLRGNAPLVIPVFIGKKDTIMGVVSQKDILFGCYAGIILCMLLYNLFLMFSIREDKSYLWYVLHTLFVGITQASFFGYSFQYLWPNNVWLARESIFIFTCLVSIVGILFLQNFLSTKTTIPKLNKVFYLFFSLYVIILALSLSEHFDIAYKILEPTQGCVALFIIFISIKLVVAGYKQARFYMLSWLLFLVSIFIFAIKDYNVVPYNLFTSTIMLSGSAVQVILLSFALGDKINVFRKEKEDSQQMALLALQENERIVREQNVMLEAMVNERTNELMVSNKGLNKALVDLKEAETHLVESEKMASLGQLTAGIAHEINNPINFVTSNVRPLNRDVLILLEAIEVIEGVALNKDGLEDKQKKINAYKEEIDYDYLKIEIDQLLSGIGEGASRTAEIVKGLRIFSRLDEDDLKKADINEGLESTLIITNNMLNNSIKIEKKYSNLPLVECYPGKLNQVFLNIISNGIFAIRKKFGESEGGLFTISTTSDEGHVYISLADNGTGMDEQTKRRLFEPFFTTKEVGEGTGLGMSIAYNTITKHSGQIIINSEMGKGTEFILKLPLIQK